MPFNATQIDQIGHYAINDFARNEPVDQGGRERLHAVDRDALADLRKHRGQARELVLHLPPAEAA